MSKTTTRNRVAVSLSTTVRMALELLADRNGITPSTQAALLLRQGLDRTIESEAFRVRYGEYLKRRTQEQRLADMAEEYTLGKAEAQQSEQVTPKQRTAVAPSGQQ